MKGPTYGNFYVRRETDTTDFIGIRRLVLSQLWRPTTWPLPDPELDAQSPGVPGVSGAMILIGKEHRDEGNRFRTYWTFEGVNGDGKTVTFKDRANSLDSAFQPGFEQMDIRKHPKISELIDRYGGIVDPATLQIIWPLTVAGNTGSRSGFQSNTTQSERPNPMFGRNEFMQVTGTYTHRYASFQAPRLTDAGRVVSTTALPGRPPRSVGNRNWLKAAAPFIWRGLVCDITELYLLSGDGGWPAPIYTLLGDASGGDQPGGGLSSGGLTTGSL
jgi:hypothetical protein